METNNTTPRYPLFLQRSRSGTPRLSNAAAAPFSPNATRAPILRPKSAAKSRTSADPRRTKENRESSLPRNAHPPAAAVAGGGGGGSTSFRRSRPSGGASAWALSPGRSPPPLPAAATEVKRKGGGVMGFFRPRRKEPSPREEAVHQLKLLTTRLLQWRLVNARAEAAMEAARCSAEGKLFYTWLRINELRNIVAAKRILYQRRKLKLKLSKVLNPQLQFLFQWESSAKRHLEAVAALSRVLGAICIALPLTEGAQANMASVYNYFCVAMEVIRDIEETIGVFYIKVENASSLLCDMANTMRQEIESLEELMKERKMTTSFEMHEISYRINLIQATKANLYFHSY